MVSDLVLLPSGHFAAVLVADMRTATLGEHPHDLPVRDGCFLSFSRFFPFIRNHGDVWSKGVSGLGRGYTHSLATLMSVFPPSEDYNTERAHPWSPSSLRRAHPGPGPRKEKMTLPFPVAGQRSSFRRLISLLHLLAAETLSDTMYLLISFSKSTLLQNRQLNISIGNSAQNLTIWSGI